jgi:hypothetical protein
VSIHYPQDEWERMARIYFQHEWETGDHRPYLDANFYTRMGRWYQSQGCDIRPLPNRQIRWRDEESRVAFWMRWA